MRRSDIIARIVEWSAVPKLHGAICGAALQNLPERWNSLIELHSRLLCTLVTLNLRDFKAQTGKQQANVTNAMTIIPRY